MLKVYFKTTVQQVDSQEISGLSTSQLISRILGCEDVTNYELTKSGLILTSLDSVRKGDCIRIIQKTVASEPIVKLSDEQLDEKIRFIQHCVETMDRQPFGQGKEFQDTLEMGVFARNQFKKRPELRSDPIALRIAKDCDLVAAIFGEQDENALQWVRSQPVLVETVKRIIEEVFSSPSSGLMDLRQRRPRLPRPPRMPVPAASVSGNVRPPFGENITADVLQRALASAFQVPGAAPPAPMAPMAQAPPTHQPPPVQQQQYVQPQMVTQLRSIYAEQLATMLEFGFGDESRNLEALQMSGGNLEAAMEYILTQNEQAN